jgi:hypothetical protein
LKFIFRLFFLLVLIVIIGSVVGVFLIIEDEPLLVSSQELTVTDIRRARVFMENSDPRNLAPGEVSAFTVDEADLELLANYGLENLLGGAAEVELEDDRADVVLSARLPENPLGNVVNLQLTLSQWGDVLAIERLKIGELTVPSWIADAVPSWIADAFMQRAHQQLQLQVPEYAAALDAINGYTIAPSTVNVVYQWQPDLVEQISNRGRDLLVPAEVQDRLLAHSNNLSAITNDAGLGRITSVVSMLSPMLQFAQARGGDPVEENRAAILALSMYIMGISVPRVLGLPADTIRPLGRHKLTLSERPDFAQHFLVSAGLTVSAGTALADSIGLLKELEDSQGGSGFSFTDIGADRTGVRFAELATANPESARAVQSMLTTSSSESLFMAEFWDLPEFMSEQVFLSQYGGVGQPAYNAVINDIENRIAEMPLFRELD